MMENERAPGTLMMQRMTVVGMPFYRWCESRGFTTVDNAFHHLLTEMFGNHEPNGPAPKPFRGESPNRHSGTSTLYGYGSADADELRRLADQFADPLLLEVLPPSQIYSKPVVTDWSEGQRLGFEIKVRPTTRRKADDLGGKMIEQDVYLRHLQLNPEGNSDKGRVYCDWLQSRFQSSGAAAINRMWLHHCSTGVMELPQNKSGPLKPKAVIRGDMTVTDPDAFNDVLRNGVGRHRAYGYGMLLLKAPSR